MKLTIQEMAQDELARRRDLVRSALAEQFKGRKPYRQDPVSNEERLVWYNDLNQDDVMYLVEKHGRDAVNQEIMGCEQIKKRRGL